MTSIRPGVSQDRRLRLSWNVNCTCSEPQLRVPGALSGRKHILSILVENKPGVLARTAGLFSRRGFNIDTLAVGPSDNERLSRITLTLDGAVHPIDQVTKQLHKLVNVLKIRDLEPADTVARELALFKVSADGVQREGNAKQQGTGEGQRILVERQDPPAPAHRPGRTGVRHSG